MTAIYDQCLDAVVLAIQNLDLTGINDNEIVKRKAPWDGDRIHRGITVSWADPDESDGTTERDDIGYPCVVTFIAGTGRSLTDRIPRIVGWHEEVRRTFHNKRISGVSSTGSNHIICKAMTRAIEVPKQFEKESIDVSQLVVICWFRESRTNVL